MTRTFYQSHECEGFRAKVTIEWSMPEKVDPDLLPAWRAEAAEDIADAILAFSGRRMRQMVQAMRGYSISSTTHFCPTCKKHVPDPCVARQNTVGCEHLE